MGADRAPHASLHPQFVRVFYPPPLLLFRCLSRFAPSSSRTVKLAVGCNTVVREAIKLCLRVVQTLRATKKCNQENKAASTRRQGRLIACVAQKQGKPSARLRLLLSVVHTATVSLSFVINDNNNSEQEQLDRGWQKKKNHILHNSAMAMKNASRRLLSPILAVAAVVVATLSGVNAATYDVTPDGSPYSIAEAIEAAGPGDTISLGDGTYDEPIVTVRDGTEGSPIVIVGSDRAIINDDVDGRVVTVRHSWTTLKVSLLWCCSREGCVL